jgi:3-oxoacyl-[acyl-carrier-protein] synthase II
MLHGDRQVLVTGLGVISPIGLTVSKMGEALVYGRSGIDYISSFDPTPFGTRIA